MKLTLKLQNSPQVKTIHLFIAENEGQCTAAPEIKHLGLAVFQFGNVHKLEEFWERKIWSKQDIFNTVSASLGEQKIQMYFFNLDFQKITKHFNSLHPNTAAF